MSNYGFYSLFTFLRFSRLSPLTSSIYTSLATKQSTSSTLSQRRQSNIFYIFPWHSCSMNSMAQFRLISITLIYFLSLVSPIICIFCWFSLTVTRKLTPSMTRIRHISIVLLLDSLPPIWDTLDLFLLRSLITNGQLDRFFITYFCFFQLSLNFSVSQFGFLYCSRFNSFAFQIQMFCNCLFLKSLFKLRLIFCWLQALRECLPIIDDIFSSSILFSLSISVNRASFCSSPFLLLMCTQVLYSIVPVLGLM